MARPYTTSKALREKLTELGFNCVKNPRFWNAGHATLLGLSENRKRIRLRVGNGRVTILDSVPDKYVLLRVVEDARVLEERESRFYLPKPLTKKKAEAAFKLLPRRDNLIVQAPRMRIENKGVQLVNSSYTNIRGKRTKVYDEALVNYKTTAPKSTLYFLIGKDEKYLFISLLKHRPKTIKAALDTLIPVEVKERGPYERQGEFLFSPVTEEERKEIDDHLFNPPWSTKNPTASGWSYPDSFHHKRSLFQDHNMTDHIAQTSLRLNGNRQFARGMIKNRRHKTLQFDDWQRVYTVEERPMPASQRSAVWD